MYLTFMIEESQTSDIKALYKSDKTDEFLNLSGATLLHKKLCRKLLKTYIPVH